MDAAHAILCIIGIILLAPVVYLVACAFMAYVLSSRISRQQESAPQQPKPELPDLFGPELDPLGAFGEQVEPDAVGQRA